MLAAQLHGKLTRSEEDLEDLLTSNVFGTLKYVSPSDGLLPVMSRAIGPQGEKPLQGLQLAHKPLYRFWCTLAEEGCNPCEPDLIIDLTTLTGDRLTVLVESKLYSGKSSHSTSDGPPDDQLAREWDNLTSLTKRNGTEPWLIYATADHSFPRDDIRESQEEFARKRGGEIRILWLPWQDLPTSLSARSCDMIGDLIELLRRQGLMHFDGFATSSADLPEWHYQLDEALKRENIGFDWARADVAPVWAYSKRGASSFKWAPIVWNPPEWRYHA